MKDYIQVSESVFRKAEERMAEKKRRSMKVKRNTLAATSAAAVLFVVLMQNDTISDAVKSFPKFVSSVWSGDEPTTTQIIPQTTVTTAAPVTTTEKKTETTTETETTTTTTMAVTEPVTTEAPVTEAVTSVDDMKQLYMVCLDTRVVEADYNTVTLSNGYKVSFEYGKYDLRGLFKVDDIIFYRASFAYDKEKGLYYYLDGYFEVEYREPSPSIESEEEGENTEPVTEEFIGAPIPPPDPETKDDELRKLKYDESIPALDYKDVIEDPSLLSPGAAFIEGSIFKIKVTGMEIKEADGYYKKFADGREWYLHNTYIDGMEDDEIYALKEGDVIDMVGFFSYYEEDDSLWAIDFYIKKVN